MKKEELPTNRMQALIKNGSKVMFIDGSFTLSINAASYELKHDTLGLNNEIWTVIAVNVSCPQEPSKSDSLSYFNNCIVKNDAGDIAFCSVCNIRNIKSLY